MSIPSGIPKISLVSSRLSDAPDLLYVSARVETGEIMIKSDRLKIE